MPYTLLSTATLGFDLVRLPAGRHVAGVLLAGLAAGPAGLARLADEHPAMVLPPAERAARADRGRRARELAAGAVPRSSATPPAGSPGPQDPAGTGSRAAVLLAQLEQGMIGDAAALERLVRTEVVEAGAHPDAGPDAGPDAASGPDADLVRERAADVLADVAVAAYAAAALPAGLRRELSAPFTAATALAPPDDHDLGPQDGRLRSLLDDVRDTGTAGRERWRAAVDAVRERRRPWAAAMHEACWAAHVSGRVRAVAAAQLLAVRAVDDAGFDAADGARGVWNALAGCVQGLALADLVEDASLDVLLEPWALVTGRRLLAG